MSRVFAHKHGQVSGKYKGAVILCNRPSSFGVRIYSVGPPSQKGYYTARSSATTRSTLRKERLQSRTRYRHINLQIFKWRSLEERRKIARLALFHKILNQNICVRLPSYIYINHLNTRSSTRSRLTSISATCNVYKYSFMPRTITEWNSLPVAVTSQKNTELF